MKRKVILFDLDGTLLPMNTDLFEKIYFKGLCQKFTNMIDSQLLVKSIWEGTKAMMLNDGHLTNREVFAKRFTQVSGLDYYMHEEEFLKFYENEFQDCLNACQVTKTSKEIIDILKQKGYTVAIATNPIFPKIATVSRMNWLGLNYEDFPLVTTFENSYHAKPNPQYFQDVCDYLNVDPQDCIMVGNDVEEDGIASKLGIEVFLITDCLLNKHNLPLDDYDTYTLEQLKQWAYKQ